MLGLHGRVPHPESTFSQPPAYHPDLQRPVGGSGCLGRGLLKDRDHVSFILVSLMPGTVSGTQRTHHQCADLDLLVFGGLVDLFEQ